MATAIEVTDMLEKTGTGEGYLRICQDFCREHHNSSGGELVDHLLQLRQNAMMSGEPILGPQPGTIDKARHLAAGRPLSDLMGKPPPRANPFDSTVLASNVSQLIELVRASTEERRVQIQEPAAG